MGSGISGRYYGTHGSKWLHHKSLIHSLEGEYTQNPKTKKYQNLKNGGHGQDAIDLMDKLGIKYNIVKTYKNGVRVGNVTNHKKPDKRSGISQSWFPKSWTQKDVVKAAEHVSRLKSNRGTPDGKIMWGTWKGVRVGVMKTNGNIATVFPDSKQPNNGRKK